MSHLPKKKRRNIIQEYNIKYSVLNERRKTSKYSNLKRKKNRNISKYIDNFFKGIDSPSKNCLSKNISGIEIPFTKNEKCLNIKYGILTCFYTFAII